MMAAHSDSRATLTWRVFLRLAGHEDLFLLIESVCHAGYNRNGVPVIIEAGIQSDEFAVEAALLNQTHIGLPFGSNMDNGSVIYGRIAAFQIHEDHVIVHLAGVGGGEDYSMIHLTHSEKLFFSHYTRESQLTASIERIEKNTAK